MKKTIQRFLSFMIISVMVFGVHYNAQAAGTTNTGLAPAQAFSTYYVSPAGSDTNAGTSAAPFKTFAKATSVLTAGDTLQVMAGSYTETLTLAGSGTASAPITVIGNGAVLNMQGAKANGITISGSYVNVSKFEISGATDFGIVITGKNVTVEGNLIHDNVTKNGVGTCGISTSWGSALKVKVGGENTTIRNNTVYNNCGEGIAITRGITALIDGNTTYDNFGVNIYIDNSPFVTVQNNLSYCTGTHLRDGNRATGIALGEESYSGWGAQLHDILVSANTVKDCRNGIVAYKSYAGGTLTNVTMTANNVPSGEQRSLSVQSAANQNVVISNNTLFNSIYVYQPAGVTLVGNVIRDSAPDTTPPPADFNGDGKTDVAVFRTSNNTWYIQGQGSLSYGQAGDIPVPADYNGDGKTDIAVFRPANNTWYIQGQGSYVFGQAEDIPVAADYDGDRKTDIAVFRPSSSTWDILGVGTFTYGQTGDLPVVADYNGDGKADIAVFRPTNSTWYLYGIGPRTYGTSGDIPVIADYNGDGKADIAVFRPTNSTWYIYGIGSRIYGTAGDIPATGDYNGDGKADIAVFRPANSTWYIYGVGPSVFGTTGDLPVAANAILLSEIIQ